MLGSVRVVSALPGATIAMTPAASVVHRRLRCCTARRSGALATWCDGRWRSPSSSWRRPTCCGRRATSNRVCASRCSTSGQADAIVVQTPRGHALLVDAGGRLERGAQSSGSVAELVGERIVVPFLLRHGIHALDAIVLSHPHGDHAGGVAPVLRKLRVAGFADGGQRYGGHAYQDALATAREKSVPMLYPRAGAEWRTDDGVTLHFLGPSLPFITGSRNDINENSLAFTLRYGSFCMLFTGDAGAAAEERFLDEGADLRCEILKVGHHGSSYSSTRAFIAAVAPQYAVISVGRHNLFGHPAPITWQRCIASVRRSTARMKTGPYDPRRRLRIQRLADVRSPGNSFGGLRREVTGSAAGGAEWRGVAVHSKCEHRYAHWTRSFRLKRADACPARGARSRHPLLLRLRREAATRRAAGVDGTHRIWRNRNTRPAPSGLHESRTSRPSTEIAFASRTLRT